MPASKRTQHKPTTVDNKANKAIESKNWRKDAPENITVPSKPLIDVSTNPLIDVSDDALIDVSPDDGTSLPLYGKDFTKIVLKASEPLTLVRSNGTTVTVPNSFLIDVSPVEKAYISSGNCSSLSIGELKMAKNPRRLRAQTDQDIDFDQKHQVFHFRKIMGNRCVSLAPEYLSKDTGARYDRVMKEKEASALMEHDEAIDRIGGVDAGSPESARRKRENMLEQDEKKKAFQALLGRLSKTGPPPRFDLSKADQRSTTSPLNLHYQQPSDQSEPSTIEISPPGPAHSDKDSGYGTESPVKKLNPAASEFKSAPPALQGGMKTHARPHVSNIFHQGGISAPVPMPAGLPPMKPFGMPFDSDKNPGGNGATGFAAKAQSIDNLMPPCNPMMQPPPFLEGIQNPMGFPPMPPLPPLGLFNNFNGMPPNMFPPFPPMPPAPPMDLPMSNNGSHFNTFPHCGPPPPASQLQVNTAFMPHMPLPNLPALNLRPPVSSTPSTILPPPPLLPQLPNATAAKTLPPPGPVAAAAVVPPHFPVTKKPRDNDPYKQQKYEEYLEWRKMYEPGFHLAAKQRQQNRFMRQRGQSQSEGSAVPSILGGGGVGGEA
ncbi:hypothetical protein NKR19_g1148 [Coniochaeta hoffmannii]|uniref:Uncharacterized protein n=1 Tax=Coniochaeta hoffmannii TaxID=91930 RepID=A0AA38VPB5_9PEZI|nr:hypothetical protein NKR19_g1148 [Coniochaeta hoffmannii]